MADSEIANGPKAIVVHPKMVSRTKAASSLDEVVRNGKDIQQEVLAGLEEFARYQGLDLGDLRFTWSLRVSAVGYQMPEELAEQRAAWLGLVASTAPRGERIQVSVYDPEGPPPFP